MSVIHTGSTARPKPELSRALMEFDLDLQKYVASAILPIFPSKVQEGTITVVRREDLLRHENTKLAPGSTYGRGALRTEATTFACIKYGHEQQVTDEDREIYKTAFDAEVVKAKSALHKVLIDREVRTETLIMNTSTWTGAALYTDNSSNPWDDVSKDIIGQVMAAIEKVRAGSGEKANALVLSTVQVNNVLQNTAIKARFPGSAVITRELILNNLVSIFGLEKLVECSGVYNSAAENQDAVMTDIWSDDYAMVARLATTPDDLSEHCLGRTLRWMGDSGDGVDVSMYREPQTDSDVVKARAFYDEKVLDIYCGHLMKVDA